MMLSAYCTFLLTAVIAYTAVPPIATLAIQTKGAAVDATLVIVNNSDFELDIESYKVFADGHLTSKVFTIDCDGQKVAYSGPMVKRRRPIADDYIHIPTHQRKSFTTDLAKSYSFPPGHHSCNVSYDAVYTMPAQDDSYTLRSNTASFKR